tara:strand:+ start:1227 stop:1982 length:756 start_codon:yes stop_codon:yes gene_type:complete
MFKKAQLTIFIIIGIVIIGLTALFFVFKGSTISNGIPANIEPFSNNFFSCFKDISKDGVYFVASHGGYFNPPAETSIIYFDEGFPYYYLESKKYVPSIRDIENELEEYISSNLKNCLDIENFMKDGFEVNNGGHEISVNINPENINVKLISSLAVTKGESTINMRNSENNLNYDLIKLHKASGEIVESYSKKTGFVCLTCLEEISTMNNVKIESLPVLDVSVFENDIIWFFITDKDDLSENKLTWRFVVEK